MVVVVLLRTCPPHLNIWFSLGPKNLAYITHTHVILLSEKGGSIRKTDPSAMNLQPIDWCNFVYFDRLATCGWLATSNVLRVTLVTPPCLDCISPNNGLWAFLYCSYRGHTNHDFLFFLFSLLFLLYLITILVSLDKHNDEFYVYAALIFLL